MRFILVLVLPIVIALIPNLAGAQVSPMCTNCLGGVMVTPDNGVENRGTNSGPWTVQFDVLNTSVTQKTFTFSCSPTGGISCVSVVPSSKTLSPDQSWTVQLTYNIGSSGGQAGLVASATGAWDDGYYVVLVPNVPAVTPDAQPRLMRPIEGVQLPFTIQNTGSTSATFLLSVTCSGVVTSCLPPSPSSVTLASTASTTVSATLSTGGAGLSTGLFTLKAKNQADTTTWDTGSYTIRLGPSGSLVRRDLCVTMSAGAGAASECGDLRLIHSLPTVRTVNKSRAPMLVYNSQSAHPYPLLLTDVTAPSPLPDSIRATLTVNGTPYLRTWPGAAWGSAGQIRRVPMGFDAAGAGLATAEYPYTLDFAKFTNGAWSGTSFLQTSGVLPIVNRSGSPFGPGWWIAGYEQLVLYAGMPDGQVMWIGGNGSVKRYDRVGLRGTDSAYIGPLVDGPDTLIHTSTGGWVRFIHGGGRVVFETTGKHIRTESRIGDTTTFVDSSGILKSITVPRDTSLKYRFTYSGSPLRLTQITLPDSAAGTFRTTTLNWVGDSVGITDPGSSNPIVFRYQPGGTNRMQSRTARRGGVTRFIYNIVSRLDSTKFALTSTDSINVSFCHAEVRGLASCSALVAPESSYTRFNGPRSDVADSLDIVDLWPDLQGLVTKVRDAYGNSTLLNRADMTWPALETRMQYPNGRTIGASYDVRGNLSVSVDSNLYSAGQHATTRYTWDQRWDEITETVMPTGELMRFAYDTTNGNRLWQEDGRGVSSRVTFTYYTSDTGRALIRTITDPTGAKDSLRYDARGNVILIRSPLGFKDSLVLDRLGRTTVAISPVGSVLRHDSTFYDQRDLVTRTVSYGPAAGAAVAQRLVVRRFYNQDGQPDSLQRWSIPDSADVDTITTRWRYDVAGRAIAEISSDMQRDSTRYDAAGNPIVLVTRRGDTLRMTYDRLGRLRRRIASAVHYPGRLAGIQMENTSYGMGRPYPWYPTNPPLDCWQTADCFTDSTQWKLDIAADTALFGYDVMGNMLSADNADARIKRSYYRDGRIQTDSSSLRTWYGNDFSQHIYGLYYRYDLSGRLLMLRHPWALAPRNTNVMDSTKYEYDATTSLLSAVIDPLGKRFDFTYNMRNERIRLVMPGGIRDTMVFDADGRLTSEKIFNGSTSSFAHPDAILRHHVLAYADGFRVSQANNLAGWGDTTTLTYSGLGHVGRTVYKAPARNNWLTATATSDEQLRLDAMGNSYWSYDLNSVKSNVVSKSNGSTHFPRFGKLSGGFATGRLRAILHTYADYRNDRSDTTLYDAAGNAFFSYQSSPGIWASLEDHAYYYGADNKLRVSDYRTVAKSSSGSEFWPWQMVFEEYRYDALGRRVVVRMQRTCRMPSGFHLYSCNWGSIRRTVWDGDQELYEIQTYGSRTGHGEGVVWDAPTWQMENDTLPLLIWTNNPAFYDASPNFGRVAYTHALGIDVPLSVIRMNFVDTVQSQPRINWSPIDVAPHWNWRGQADFGTLGDGGWRVCTSPPPQDTRCANPPWRIRGFMYTQQVADTARPQWWGSLLSLKEDGTGTQYRRNRYLDPSTGRFTQEDPLGVGGGINLYGFGGGDPLNFSDPFGLCKKPKGEGIGICLDVYIRQRWVGPAPVGDGRGPNHHGGSYKAQASFSIDPRTGKISGIEPLIGRTWFVRGSGGVVVSPAVRDRQGEWQVRISVANVESAMVPPWWDIDADLTIHVSANGEVNVSGSHDGFPSYDVWMYPTTGNARLIYTHKERKFTDLGGEMDKVVP
jgi:RHS repeat-associated protein